jgi:hypothetical protein
MGKKEQKKEIFVKFGEFQLDKLKNPLYIVPTVGTIKEVK